MPGVRAPTNGSRPTSPPVQDQLVELTRIGSGDRVLDLASGSGRGGGARRGARSAGDGDRHRGADARSRRASVAAAAGADDHASTSATSSTCRTRTRASTSSLSNFGLIFAPDHANVASELARVARPGAPPRLHRVEAEPEARRALPPLHRGADRRPRGVRVGARGPRRGHARRGLRARVRGRDAVARGRLGRGDLGAVLGVGAAGDRARQAARRAGRRAVPPGVRRALRAATACPRAASARRAATCWSWVRASERRGHRAAAAAHPRRHHEPAGQRDRGGASCCATTSRRPASSASSTRACPSARTSSRASAAPATGRRSRCSRTPTSCSPTRAEWERDPFGGELVDGEVWGRGALDMKCEVAASAVALATLAREGWRGARRPGLHRRRRRGGRRRLRARVARRGASGRRAHRLLGERGRRRARRARRTASSTCARPPRR